MDRRVRRARLGHPDRRDQLVQPDRKGRQVLQGLRAWPATKAATECQALQEQRGPLVLPAR